MLSLQPLLDVIVFTRSLSRSMGYRGQLGLYLYYLLSAAALRKLSPPLALMTAQESSLSGGFRAAHQVQPYFQPFTTLLPILIPTPKLHL